MTLPVTVAVTGGEASMDRYGQELATRLEVRTLRLGLRRAGAVCFGVPLASPAALAGTAEDLAVAVRLRRERGLLHLTHHHLARYAALRGRPFVVTVHDLIRWHDLTGRAVYIARPGARDRLGLRLDYRALRRAAALIAVSHATRRDLVTLLGISPERVHVVHEGLDHARFRPVPARPVQGRYVLFVGSEHPRKNLVTLLRAFAELKRSARFRDLRLVKVGEAGTGEAPFRRRTLAVVRDLGLERDVVFAERVPDEALPGYYSGAAVLALPSLAEGFGLPPLEAMACGCPVVTSTAGALPEVTGGAALRVPPTDSAALSRALEEVLTDEGCAAALRDRGLRRAATFTWERTAHETLAVYRRVRASL